jgi:hypothetical protein
MTVTETLLSILILLTLARLYQSHRQHAETADQLNAIGDIIGDYYKAFLEELRKEK